MREYKRENISRAKALRRDMTPWERKLWYTFLRSYPIRFQRQKAIGCYIVDFFCAKAGIALELDGGGHYEPGQQQKDELRTRALAQSGVQVIRICNRDIDLRFREVCEMIDETVRRTLPTSTGG